MEARIYFRRKSVLNRMEKTGIEMNSNEKEDFYVWISGQHYVAGDIRDPDLAFVKIFELVDLNIPKHFYGLRIVKVSLFDALLKEENSHIKQGAGKEGGTDWFVTYGDEKFDVPTASKFLSAYAFRSIIRVRIKGRDLQSVKQCYNKIRNGDMIFNWKGDADVPSHCGLNTFLRAID